MQQLLASSDIMSPRGQRVALCIYTLASVRLEHQNYLITPYKDVVQKPIVNIFAHK